MTLSHSMNVKIQLISGKTDTISIEEWNRIGGEKGYAKNNKIHKNQIIGIEYIVNQTNQNDNN